jgi:transposase
LYYDCTNFYFEIEEEDNISNEECDEEGIAARKYGHCKQHQPSPIVQMGLFMDYSGIPLAMEIDRGNKNEQITLVPLEKKILADFGVSKFVVCTDAALSSGENRMFNNWGERSYVTAVSIKQMDAKKRNGHWTPPVGNFVEEIQRLPTIFVTSRIQRKIVRSIMI